MAGNGGSLRVPGQTDLRWPRPPVHHILVHVGPEESRVGVSAADFGLDLVEAVWGWILLLLGLFPGAVVDVPLSG